MDALSSGTQLTSLPQQEIGVNRGKDGLSQIELFERS